MNEFIIMFRETLEAVLIVGIIYTILIKNKFHILINQLWIGVAASIMTSIAFGYMMVKLKDITGNSAYESLFEGIFLFLTAGFIFYVIFWLSKHTGNIDTLKKNTLKTAAFSSWGIFFLVFFSILREGFETVIFLLSSFKMQGSFSYLGFFLGAVLAILIGYLIVLQGKKVDLKKLFQYTTLGLVFIAAGMIAYGTHEIEEYSVKSGIIAEQKIDRAWDVLKPKEQLSASDIPFLYQYNVQKERYIHLLHDKGSIGAFLKGFFGYNSNPNYLEVLLWGGALFFGIRLWRKHYFSIYV